MLRVNDGRVACEIPLTYHRSLPSAKQLESDRANWPKDEAVNQGERAAEASCAAIMPHFSTVLAAKAVRSTSAASGKVVPCTVAANSVELDIEDMVADQDGLGPVPGLFPVRAETEVELPVVFTIEEAMIAEQQIKRTGNCYQPTLLVSMSSMDLTMSTPVRMLLATTLSMPPFGLRWTTALNRNGEA